MAPQRVGSIASVLLRMAVFIAAVLSPLSANAADTESDRADDTKLSSGRTAQPEPAHLEGIVVVGSRLPAAVGQSAQDIHVYQRERIEQSG